MRPSLLKNIKNKIKNKTGGTHLVEVLILTPFVMLMTLMQLCIFQEGQEINYIEDVKVAMTQEMSREGNLTEDRINSYWKNKYEAKQGVTLKSFDSIENKIPRESKQPMEVNLVFQTKTSFLSFIFGGEYKTKALIYSEYVND